MRARFILAVTLPMLAGYTPAAFGSASCGIIPSTNGFNRALSFHQALTNHEPTAPPDIFVSVISSVLRNDAPGAMKKLSIAYQTKTKPEDRAEIAYWAAKASDIAGNKKQSQQFLAMAATISDSFYGQLAGTTQPANVGKYPLQYFRYIDPRTDYALVWAVIRQESRFHTKSISPAGALGLMQVIPQTAQAVTKAFGSPLNQSRMLQDPHYAVAIGSTWLGYLYNKYNHNIPLTLAAYNGGELCADKWSKFIGDPRETSTNTLLWIESIPYDETRNYIKGVLTNYVIYRQATKSHINLPTK